MKKQRWYGRKTVFPHKYSKQFSRFKITHDALWKAIKKRLEMELDNLIIVTGVTGCQPAGDKVLMADGSWKNIEEIKIGDEVMSPQKDGTNTFSKVTSVTNWLCDNTYDVVQMNRNKKKLYSCSNNHIIPFYHRFNKRSTDQKGKRYEVKKWWDFKEFTAERVNSMSKDTFSHNNIGFYSFPIKKFKGRKNCIVEPYSLGVYLGDGYFGNQLRITSNDPEVINEVNKHYPYMNCQNKKETTCKDYSFSTEGLFARDLSLCNLRDKKSGDKFIPETALHSDINYRKKLLAGLIDSDGYYHNGGYDYVSKSKKLVEGIKHLVHSIGGRTYEIKEIEKKIKSRGFKGKYYRITFYLGDIKIPLITKRRKRDISRSYLEPKRIAIYTEKSTPKRVYGFSLDSKSKWYITNNWMVTHNSGKSSFVGNLCFKKAANEPNFVENDGTMMFEDEKGFVIDPDEFAVKLIQGSGDVLWVDESRDALSRRNWASKINKTIISRKNKNRKLRKVVFLLFPYEIEIDKEMAKHATLWIWVKKRGLCEVYCRRSGIKGGSGLNIEEILKREERFFKENPDYSTCPPEVHPEFIGRMVFGKLTANLEKRYLHLVELKKATGELSDEEKIKYGIEVKKDPKDIVNEIIEKIKSGEIKDKKTVWEKMEETKLEYDKKVKLLNFYLKLEGWDNFNKLFDKKKLEQAEIDW